MEKSGLLYYKELLGILEMPEFLIKYLWAPCLLRLLKIGYISGMNYASEDVYKYVEFISKYDYNLSDALLTWKLTKDKKATLAALFNNVSVPCFSSAVDRLKSFHNPQESTEKYSSGTLKNSRYLEPFLVQDQITIEDIINSKKYSIVDSQYPRLCTKKLNEIVLTGYSWTRDIQPEDMKAIIDDLEIYQNERKEPEIGFRSEDIAKKVVESEKKAYDAYNSKDNNYMMELLADILYSARDERAISYEELYALDEESIMLFIKKSTNPKIITMLERFKNITNEEIPNIKLPDTKIQLIDPLVRGRRLSTRN